GPSALRVIATSAYPEQGLIIGGTAESGLVDEAASFKITGVTGKVLFRAISLPMGWSMKSVKLQGQDITDVPFDLTTNTTGLEVTLTDRQASVSGLVHNTRGQPVKDFVVVLLPRNLRDGLVPNRFINNLRPDQDGRFLLRPIVPGDYLVAAVESLDSGEEWDPTVQQRLRDQAKPFTVNEGQAITLDLTLLE